MSVLMIIDLKAKADSVNELRAFLSPRETRDFAGNDGVELVVNQDDPANLLLVIHWASREASDAYSAWRRENSDHETLVGLLDGGMDGFKVRTFEVAERLRAKRSKTRDEALEDLEEWSKRWLSLRAQIRELADEKLSAEHLGPVIKLHNEELDSIMSELAGASE
jgi:heme-degrading monooxygenase HmoA